MSWKIDGVRGARESAKFALFEERQRQLTHRATVGAEFMHWQGSHGEGDLGNVTVGIKVHQTNGPKRNDMRGSAGASSVCNAGGWGHWAKYDVSARSHVGIES